MIISRTPYRVSFFGGGTDYHKWYQEHGGAVLSTSINHYCYITCRYLPPFFDHKSRVIWSEIEEVNDHKEIKHRAVKAVLQYLKMEKGVEISHQGGLPARSGLGSSSTFTVGLLNAVYALRGIMSTDKELACEAVHIERDVIKENVGVQDQITAAYGGFNKITINQDGNFVVDPVVMPFERFGLLQNNLLLFFTGVSRTASKIAKEQIDSIPKKQTELHEMRKMVDESLKILTKGNDINDFGRLLNESWKLKKSLSSGIAPGFVDDIYKKAMDAGAIGGKLLGAGGGGFMLFFVPPEKQPKVFAALSDLLLVPFEFETGGSHIIYYDNTRYSRTSMVRRDYMHLKDQKNDIEEIGIEELLQKRKSKLNVV